MVSHNVLGDFSRHLGQNSKTCEFLTPMLTEKPEPLGETVNKSEKYLQVE